MFVCRVLVARQHTHTFPCRSFAFASSEPRFAFRSRTGRARAGGDSRAAREAPARSATGKTTRGWAVRDAAQTCWLAWCERRRGRCAGG
eukprot:847148-Prymnesium_polylepis.1